MKALKVVLGLGAACAACCAIPLFAAGTGGVAFGAALLACARELLPAAGVLLAVAGALVGAWWWWRDRTARRMPCACVDACAAGPGCAPR